MGGEERKVGLVAGGSVGSRRQACLPLPSWKLQQVPAVLLLSRALALLSAGRGLRASY